MADVGQDGMPAVVDSTKDEQQQTKALDSITDHVEERQLDSTRVQQAMATISAKANADKQAQRLKELELSKVKINQADVDIMVDELELDKKEAEKRLREHKGDIESAFEAFLNE